MNVENKHPPQELLEAHAYYHHVLFQKTFSSTNEMQSTLADLHLQKFAPTAKTILAVQEHNCSLAYPKLLKACGAEQMKIWVHEFYVSDAAQSLIIHKQMDAFFLFLKKTKTLVWQNHPQWFLLLEEDHARYHLLYALDVPRKSVVAPTPDTPLLECALLWHAPWLIWHNELWVRNPHTLLIDVFSTPSPQLWQHLKQNPWCTLQDAMQACLDKEQNFATQDALDAITSVLPELLRRDMVSLSNPDSL